MTTALVKRQTGFDIDIDHLQRVATMLAASGYFDAKGTDRQAIAQLATKILAGHEMGIPPFAAAQGIHVIQGRPTLGANLMAAKVKEHPHYDYRVRELTNESASIEYFQQGESIGVSTFTWEDAKRAGVTNKDNWKRYPSNMLFARAMSNGVRWHCPDVFSGNTVYVPEELDGNDGGNTSAVDELMQAGKYKEVGNTLVDMETGEILYGGPNAIDNDVLDDATDLPDEVPFQNENGSAPETAPAQPPVVGPTGKLHRHLHAVGTDCYEGMFDGGWKAKRGELTAHYNEKMAEKHEDWQPIESSNDWPQSHARKVIAGMQKLIDETVADTRRVAEGHDVSPVDLEWYAAQAGVDLDKTDAKGYALLNEMSRAQLEALASAIMADAEPEKVEA